MGKVMKIGLVVAGIVGIAFYDPVDDVQVLQGILLEIKRCVGLSVYRLSDMGFSTCTYSRCTGSGTSS